MSWYYLNQPYITADPLHQGFVYEITDTFNKKLYIGKKLFWTTKKLPPLKGLKNKRHRKIETTWADYYGSCDALSAEIARIGVEHFERRILYMCANKNQMSYFETKEQFDRDVLFKPEYYNGMISCRITARGLPT